jgi:hypothetical protein
MIKYKVRFFIGEDAELVILVESPLETTPETEENVHTLIDMAETIAKLKFGEDILDTLGVWGSGIEPDDDEWEDEE